MEGEPGEPVGHHRRQRPALGVEGLGAAMPVVVADLHLLSAQASLVSELQDRYKDAVEEVSV